MTMIKDAFVAEKLLNTYREMTLQALLEGNDIKDEDRPKIREVLEYSMNDLRNLKPSLIPSASLTILPLLRRVLPTADLSLSAQEIYETYFGRIKEYLDDDFKMLPKVQEEFLSCLDIDAELMSFLGNKISGRTQRLQTITMGEMM